MQSKSTENSNLKVLMLLDNPFIADARVEKEAITLVNAGFDVTVACVKKENLPADDVRNGILIKRIITEGFESPLRRGFEFLINDLAEKILQYDFSFLHCHDFYMLHIGVLVKQKKPAVKLVYDSHEHLSGWPFYLDNVGFLNKLKGWFVWKKLIMNEKMDIQHPDEIVTITKPIAKRFEEKLIKNKGVKIVGNFPVKTELTNNKTYFHDKYNIEYERKVIVHSGTVYFNDEQIKDLFKIVVDQNLFLVFIGNRAKIDELKDQVSKNESLRKNIFFHPYLSTQSEMISLLSNAHIGLMFLQMKWEAHKIGFSNRFVEYVAAEIPVLATPQLFTEQIVKEYKCAEFFSLDLKSTLEPAIASIEENYDTYKDNVCLAKQDLSWETEGEKLINLYRNLAD